jgi:hypothetical protein
VTHESKGGLKARRFGETFLIGWVPGRSEAPPGLESYFLDFFFDFDFFAFFAFFAFLAIASSFGLMDGNATRGMLGGGPASQHPRLQSNRFAGCCPVLSRRRHHVIHRCYGFLARFDEFDS